MTNEKTIDACRDAFNAARKTTAYEAWALHYGLWLLDLAEDGARLRADGELPLAGEAEIVLPEPDEYGRYVWPDEHFVDPSCIQHGMWYHSADEPNFTTTYYDTPHAAARALAALGKGPGAKEVRK